MEAFTRWLAGKLIKDHANVNSLKVRSQYGGHNGCLDSGFPSNSRDRVLSRF